jgi:hypothetical protein
MFKTWAALCGALILAGGTAQAAGLRGEYVEARTNDVFTGPCFSNAEVFITGHQAVVAWSVTEGSFQGVDLAGLKVAAAVVGTSTFDADQADAARAILIVDKAANPKQRAALIAMAKSLGGDRLKNVVEVRDSVISMMIEHDSDPASIADEHARHNMPRAARAFFWAPGLAEIVTRPLDDGDHKCGNETLAYPPLSKGVDVKPSYTVNNSFRGQGLGTRWDDPNARSSMVGHFAL